MGLMIRFGGHTDDIARREQWLRPSQVHWAWALDVSDRGGKSLWWGALHRCGHRELR